MVQGLARLEADRPGRAVPFLDKCVELGIKNIHVHKGPTIWPLDKDAFDVSDVDHVATDYNGELNFIVEHVGLPRIEDFCFMATQEPNVYAGLAVVVGGLMHARPNFFAKVMGELLFWVGEDKMLFGSDYAIWEPKWQIEGFLDWEMPDDAGVQRLPAPGRERQEKILGLNAAKLYGVEVPEELRGRRCRPTSRPREDSAVGVAMTLRSRVLEALGTVYDPELDEPITTLGFVGSCVVTGAGDVSVRLRLPTPQCAPNFAFLMAADASRRGLAAWPGVESVDVDARGPLHGRRDQRGGQRGDVVLRTRSRARRGGSWTRCGRCSSARRCVARQARLLAR